MLLSNEDLIVLSVKPQRLSGVLKGLLPVSPEAFVLSIVAGAPIQKIAAALENAAVVRAMPNTPAQIGEGITVRAAAPELSIEPKEFARSLLGVG